VIALVTILASILVSSTAAYALSKLNFKLKKTIFSVNTIALMFVPIAVTIPRFLIINGLGMIDTFWVHILPALAMPVGLFLLKQFIDAIPGSGGIITTIAKRVGCSWNTAKNILPSTQPFKRHIKTSAKKSMTW